MINTDLEQDLFAAMSSVEDNASSSRPPVDAIHQRLAIVRRHSRMRKVGAVSVLLLFLIGGAWFSGATLNDTSQIATSDDSEEPTVDTNSAPATASVEELAEWVFAHNTAGIGNTPSSFGVVALSDQTTAPLSGTEVEIRINTDGERSDILLSVGNGPCENQFAIGLITPGSPNEFIFRNNVPPTIGPPTEFTMAEPLCQVPQPTEFFDLLAQPFTLATNGEEVTFTATGSGRGFTFITT